MENLTNVVKGLSSTRTFSQKFSQLFTHLKSPSKSVIENFYPLALFGHCLGFLPLQNVLPKFQGLEKLKFALLSYPVLYTVVLNIFSYFFVVEATYYYYGDGFGFKFSTDAFALKIFFGAYSLTKASIHFFTIWRCPQILDCLKSLENYDHKFHHKNQTWILNRYFGIFLVGTVLSSVFNTMATFSDTYGKVKQNFVHSHVNYRNSSLYRKRYWSLTLVPEPLTVTIFSFVTHQIAELAMFFSQGTIAFLVNCICDRIKAISTDIKDIQHRLNPHEEDEDHVETTVVSTTENNKDKKRRRGAATKNLEIQSHPEIHLEEREGENFNVSPTCDDNNIVSKIGLSVGRSISTNTNTTNTVTGWSQPSRFLSTSVQLTSSCEGKEVDESELVLNRLKTIKKKVLSLMDLCQQLNEVGNEVILIFTTGSTVIIVSLFYLIVMYTTSLYTSHGYGQAILFPKSADITTTSIAATTIILIAILTIARLLNFANTGEKLQNSLSRLNTSVKRLDSTSTLRNQPDITAYFTYLCFVTASANASLSGCGFFRLNRAALTAIISPVVTFIVILAQFRVTDIQFLGRNSTMTT